MPVGLDYATVPFRRESGVVRRLLFVLLVSSAVAYASYVLLVDRGWDAVLDASAMVSVTSLALSMAVWLYAALSRACPGRVLVLTSVAIVGMSFAWCTAPMQQRRVPTKPPTTAPTSRASSGPG